MQRSAIPPESLALLQRGTVIPAHLLALDASRHLDERRQRALSRYYLDAGAGGLAVGVHSTQFAIREAGIYPRVLELAADEASRWEPLEGKRPLVLIAGLAGKTAQAVAEAQIAERLGYHAGLLSLAALRGASEDALIAHCKSVAEVLALVGFYLQPAVGGLHLPASFWRRFAAIDNVVAIKIAPFNRYRTLDVIRGVLDARAEERVVLYTGNDDHIVPDLLTPFTLSRDGSPVTLRMRGGLLGHWSVNTRRAVELLARIHAAIHRDTVPRDLLALDARITECNAALFDVANDFRGCIPGCHEVLRRQGLLQDVQCLDPDEVLSPGQAEELTRVHDAYPELTDDAFIAELLPRWLS